MAKEKQLTVNLLEGSIPRVMARFMLPFMFANILQICYNMIDMIVVGQFVGSAGMTAVSLGGQLQHIFTCVAMGLAGAGQIMAAQYVGAGQKKEVNSTIGSMFSLLAVVTVVLMVLGFSFGRPLLRLMDTPEEALDQAVAYLNICLVGLVFISGYNAVCSVMRGLGDSKRPLMFICISSVMNLLLDLLFVSVLGMQAAGAALATVIAQAVAFVCALAYMYSKREHFYFDFKRESFRMQADKIKHLFRLGVPNAIQMAAIGISFLFVCTLVNQSGVSAAAGYAAGSRVDSITNIVIGAVTMASGTMIAQNIAARKIDRVIKTIGFALVVAGSYATVCFIVMRTWPEVLLRLFTSDPEVIEAGVTYVRIMAFSSFAHVLMGCFSGLITGVGFAMLAMFNSLMDGVVLRISLSWLFSRTLGYGYRGVVIGNCLAVFWPGIVGLIYFLSGKWKTRKLIARKQEDV